MSKELGYIKIEDVLELVKLVHRVNMETWHYVDFIFCGFSVSVYVMKHGFQYPGKAWDFVERFSLYNPCDEKEEAEMFCKIRNYLKGLLGEKNETV